MNQTNPVNIKSDLIPENLREPGMGEWSYRMNGHSIFLKTAIQQTKEAMSTCADKGLNAEYEIFSRRLKDLEEEMSKLTKK